MHEMLGDCATKGLTMSKTLGEIALYLVNLSDDLTQSDAHRRVASAALGAMAETLYDEACEGADAMYPPWPAREGLPKDDDGQPDAGPKVPVRHG
jgi:hypothetical protein